jgi:nitroimidazol reductase NimA-like FMN-containing flavoprotein (pyridoxamine 5'-phosphate oxidase superfamily)
MTSDGTNGAADQPVHRSALETLTADECRAWLARRAVGSFLFAADRGPVAIPVNYKMLGNDIVFRTDDHTAAAGAISQQRVSFLVDRFDEDRREGCSVLVSGTAIILTRPEDIHAAAELGIAPWAGGDRDTYIRIMPDEITGRRIRNATSVLPQQGGRPPPGPGRG